MWTLSGTEIQQHPSRYANVGGWLRYSNISHPADVEELTQTERGGRNIEGSGDRKGQGSVGGDRISLSHWQTHTHILTQLNNCVFLWTHIWRSLRYEDFQCWFIHSVFLGEKNVHSPLFSLHLMSVSSACSHKLTQRVPSQVFSSPGKEYPVSPVQTQFLLQLANAAREGIIIVILMWH